MGKYVNKDVENTSIFKHKDYVGYKAGKANDPHPKMQTHLRAMASKETNIQNNNPNKGVTLTKKSKVVSTVQVMKKGVLEKITKFIKEAVEYEGMTTDQDVVNPIVEYRLDQLLKRKQLIGTTLVKTKLNSKGIKVAVASLQIQASNFSQQVVFKN